MSLRRAGRLKGAENVIDGRRAAAQTAKGRATCWRARASSPFLRMNSNSYLGLAPRAQVMAAEEEAVRRYGAGPGRGAVHQRHLGAARGARARGWRSFTAARPAMLFSSAYATRHGRPAAADHRQVPRSISDELNHNCIINAIALARPAEKRIYRHLDFAELERQLRGGCSTAAARAIVVTDGVFSMRGDHAPLDEIIRASPPSSTRLFAENVLVVVDDSHGVGAFGATGRGTEEIRRAAPQVDVLVGTLGKAFGVNGGYVVGSAIVVRFLRETSPFYIYSNPITPAEAAAARAAVEILDSPEGAALLAHLRAMTAALRRRPRGARARDARRASTRWCR